LGFSCNAKGREFINTEHFVHTKEWKSKPEEVRKQWNFLNTKDKQSDVILYRDNIVYK
jgi:hypothetical protein